MNNDNTAGRVNLRGQRQAWCWTYNDPSGHDETVGSLQRKLQADEHVRYYVFQVENAPTTGTTHFQGKSLFLSCRRKPEQPSYCLDGKICCHSLNLFRIFRTCTNLTLKVILSSNAL